MSDYIQDQNQQNSTNIFLHCTYPLVYNQMHILTVNINSSHLKQFYFSRKWQYRGGLVVEADNRVGV